jgi:hypothetical protein
MLFELTALANSFVTIVDERGNAHPYSVAKATLIESELQDTLSLHLTDGKQIVLYPDEIEAWIDEVEIDVSDRSSWVELDIEVAQLEDGFSI